MDNCRRKSSVLEAGLRASKVAVDFDCDWLEAGERVHIRAKNALLSLIKMADGLWLLVASRGFENLV